MKRIIYTEDVLKVFLEDKIRGNGVHLESEIQADIRKASFLSVEVVKHWNEGGGWVMSFSKPLQLLCSGRESLTSPNKTKLL